MSPKPVMPDDSVSTENGDNSTETATDPDGLEDTTGSFSGGTESGSSVDTGTPSDTSSAAGETSDAA
jgi:hypothetical protein